jgi:hypothetical protein
MLLFIHRKGNHRLIYAYVLIVTSEFYSPLGKKFRNVQDMVRTVQKEGFERGLDSVSYYPLANEVAKGYSNATFRNILVNTLESTSFNGF